MWLTKQISKREPLVNKEVQEYKELEEQELDRENPRDYIRKNGRIHISMTMISSKEDLYKTFYKFSSV